MGAPNPPLPARGTAVSTLPAFTTLVTEIDTGDTAWLLVSSALVLLMAPGLALFYGGMVRSKSVLNMMMMTFGALAVILVLWTLVGYSLAFGDDIGGGVLGNPLQYAGLGQLLSPEADVVGTVPAILFAVFQGLFCVITGALVSGAIADRARFGAWLVFIGAWTLLVYAPVAHWVFDFSAGDHVGGWLANQVGVIDFAGGTAVEICSGASGLALALVLGKRIGFGRDPMRPHNLTLVERFRDGKATSLGAASGMVAGLVAITPSGGSLTPIGALLMGGVAGVVCAAAVGLKFRFGYDDSLDVVGVHLVGGLIGTLGIGLLGTSAAPTAVDGLFYGGGVTQLGKQAIGAAVVLVYAFVVSAALGYAVERLIGFRLIPEHEVSGIDLAIHGETAYDFHTVTGGRAGGHGILRSLSHPEED